MQLKDLKRGETFEYCGNRWIVLEHDDENNTLVLSENIIGIMLFDESNCDNYANSTIRKYLNGGFVEYLSANSSDFMPYDVEANDSDFSLYEMDLTADDGTSYGKFEDHIFLLTADMYRRNRDVIKPVNSWYWTATAGSALNSHLVRTVRPNGMLGLVDVRDCTGGVRPACYLNSNITRKYDFSLPEKSETPLEVIRLKVEIEDMRERLSEIEDELASIIGEGD